MDAGPGYDTSRLEALRQDLRQLNTAAIETRLIPPPVRGRPGQPASAAPSRPARTASSRDGKAGASRLLALLRHVEGDDSPLVPGTDFTEAGVVRLLAHLRNPGSRAPARYLQWLRRFLARPVQFGLRVSAGVSVERLQWVSRYLNDIETYGLAHVRAVNAARRGSQAPPLPATAGSRPTKVDRAARPKRARVPASGHAEPR